MREKKDDGPRSEPTLELPPLRLPGLGRRATRRQERNTEAAAPVADAEPVADAGPVAVTGRTRVPVIPAVVATGLLVGLVGTAATYAALRGCEAARGTASCGQPGFFFLVGIVVLMAVLGGVLLAALRVTDPRSTSCLAVGVVCVVVLVALLDVIFSGWMFAVVPLVTGAAYAASHWLTTRFTEPLERAPGPDVR